MARVAPAEPPSLPPFLGFNVSRIIAARKDFSGCVLPRCVVPFVLDLRPIVSVGHSIGIGRPTRQGRGWQRNSTQKPVECMERPIHNHKGDVYDPFVGSGTTIIAAERQGRRCFAVEISPAYCDVVIQRWEAYTGKKAERLATERPSP